MISSCCCCCSPSFLHLTYLKMNTYQQLISFVQRDHSCIGALQVSHQTCDNIFIKNGAIEKYLGDFCNTICCQNLSKIAQSGHTGYDEQGFSISLGSSVAKNHYCRGRDIPVFSSTSCCLETNPYLCLSLHLSFFMSLLLCSAEFSNERISKNSLKAYCCCYTFERRYLI